MFETANHIANHFDILDFCPTRNEIEQKIDGLSRGKFRRPVMMIAIDGAHATTRPEPSLWKGKRGKAEWKEDKGIPVIVVGNNSGLTHNPTPETITSDIWRLCYTPQEIADVIQFYQTCSLEKINEHEKGVIRIREEYFEPVTSDGVREFLRLNL